MKKQISYLFFTLLFPLVVLILGFMDNTAEFFYPFILGFFLAFIFYFRFDKKKEKENGGSTK